jgi:hypothetical protein
VIFSNSVFQFYRFLKFEKTEIGLSDLIGIGKFFWPPARAQNSGRIPKRTQEPVPLGIR